MSRLAGVDQIIREYETTKGGGCDEACFELRHIPASTSDDDDIMTTTGLFLANDVLPCPPDLSKSQMYDLRRRRTITCTTV